MCVALSVASQLPSSAGAQDPPTIAIERSAPGRWRATYALPRPVTSLRFQRTAANHRERVWNVVTPGYRWAVDGDRVVLRLDEGATAAATITVEFPELTDPLPKEYELFQPFSDGAVALYTGHFYARPTGPSWTDSTPPVQSLTLVPPRGTQAVVRGRVVAGTVTYTDSIGDGTYIYMGTATPIETPHLTAIVDPGMPAWLRDMFDRRLPELFASYRERFGAALPWKPVVLYSFHDTATTGYSSGGGTLTGLINMTLTGADWRTPDPAAAEQAFYLLAHESAHLWNGQLVASEGGRGSWMHEGSADYLANDMLLSFGIIDRSAWRQRREAALNACGSQVMDAAVHQAAERGMFRTFYDCGFVLAMWTEAVARQTDQGADLSGFWRRLIAAAQADGARYDEALYFRVLREGGVADSVVQAMTAFLAARDIEPAVRGLSNAGIAVAEAGGDPPGSFQQILARRAFAHVMGTACGRISFNWGDPIVTVALPACEPFRESLRVHALEGFRLRDQAASAYDAVAATCAAGSPVRVQGADGETLASVPCRRELVPRPPWYELRG